jgi:hypothetical protein
MANGVNFVSPLALFLFSVFLMVAVFGLIGGPFGPVSATNATAMAKARTDAANQLATVEAEIRQLQAQKAALKAKGEKNPDLNERLGDLTSEEAELRLVTKGVLEPDIRTNPIDVDKAGLKTGVPGVDHIIRHAAANPELTAYKLQSSAYKFSWALIPISLPFIWVLFAVRWRDVGMYDHAVFATYSLAAMTLLVVAVEPRFGGCGSDRADRYGAGVLPAMAYVPAVEGHLFGLGRFGALWRTFFADLSRPIPRR